MQATMGSNAIPANRLNKYILESISLECSAVLNKLESDLTIKTFKNHNPRKNPKMSG